MANFRVYQDTKTGNIVIAGSNYQPFYADDLQAQASGDNIQIIRTMNENRVVVGYKPFGEFLREDGSPAGADVTATVNYLNGVFASDYASTIRIDANQIDNLTITDGQGFTGGSYDAQTGVVTFTSDDGLGFSTGDLRGADGQDGQDGQDGTNGADGQDGADGLTLVEVNAAIAAYLLANPVGGNNGLFNIWAEENSSLGTNATEWAFGNGANTPQSQGVVIPVSCELLFGTLNLRQGSATVGIYKNGTKVHDIVSVGTSTVSTLLTPVSFASGDVLGFRTTLASGTNSPNVVCAWLREL